MRAIPASTSKRRTAKNKTVFWCPCGCNKSYQSSHTVKRHLEGRAMPGYLQVASKMKTVKARLEIAAPLEHIALENPESQLMEPWPGIDELLARRASSPSDQGQAGDMFPGLNPRNYDDGNDALHFDEGPRTAPPEDPIINGQLADWIRQNAAPGLPGSDSDEVSVNNNRPAESSGGYDPGLDDIILSEEEEDEEQDDLQSDVYELRGLGSTTLSAWDTLNIRFRQQLALSRECLVL